MVMMHMAIRYVSWHRSDNQQLTIDNSYIISCLRRWTPQEDQAGQLNQLKKMKQVKQTVEEDKPSQTKTVEEDKPADVFYHVFIPGAQSAPAITR